MSSRAKLMLLGATLIVAVALIRPPSAAIRIAAHDPADLAPQRIEAVLDLGLMALSLIVTWSADRLRG